MREYFMTTARLGFSTWTEADLDNAMELWGDPEVTRLIVAGGTMSAEQVRQRLLREMQTLAQSGLQYWQLFLLESGANVGCCGLRPYNMDKNILEIGAHIKRRFWGLGFAQEASLKAMEYAFTELGAEALFAGHNPKNTTSRYVLEKLGFRYTHDEFYEPTGLYHPSYLITKREYVMRGACGC